MLSLAQEKLIRSLHTKKGRERAGKCLVEGTKVIETAKQVSDKTVEFTFTPEDTLVFQELVTTETPQNIAGVATIPTWTLDDVHASRTIVVLDGVQDPGNVGAILRLCLGFDASLVLVETADVTNPKVVRSSVGALFQVPWIKLDRDSVMQWLSEHTNVFRLELTPSAEPINSIQLDEQIVLIAGSEGHGIQLPIAGTSVAISHSKHLESLNVANALAIALAYRYQ